MKAKQFINNQRGFTLIEIIAVLVLLGILAAVAVPKYMDLAAEARNQAAQGQIAEVKGRLAIAMASFMLQNGGVKPATGAALVTAANTLTADSCPTAEAGVDEGDFTFSCTGAAAAQAVTITVLAVQDETLAAPVTDTYNFAD